MSSILLFSDTHLDTHFDQARFSYLQKIISSVDQVIIVGDFWDYWYGSFDQFVNSKWQALFPLLKSKHTVYLYGNHDPQRLADERVNLFSDIQANSYRLQLNSQKYFITHGRQYLPPETILMKRYTGWIESIKQKSNPATYYHFIKIMENIYFFLLRSKAIAFSSFLFPRNPTMRSIGLKDTESEEILICGHSHLPETDISGRFLNTGCFYHHFVSYITITDGKIKLTEDHY